jgi:hypothetical protein
MITSKYKDLIPEIYPNAFPEGFVLRPSGWALTDEVIFRDDVPHTAPDGAEMMIRPIGTMDVEFLSNDLVGKIRDGRVSLKNNYPCGNKCPACFSEDDVYTDAANLMTWQETMAVLDEARTIGLTSIKFLGPGELFENPDLFDILDAVKQRGLKFSIFTKGAELGSDELAYMNYKCTAKELVQRVATYDNVRILLGFNSFDTVRQDALVGASNKTTHYRIEDGMFVDRGVANYTEVRNQALINLVEVGLNQPRPDNVQRLSLIAAPIFLKQIDEIADMYEWSARRNMPMVIVPTMDSGPKAQNLTQITLKQDCDQSKLQNFFEAVYQRAFQIGVLTKEQVEHEGISPYIGTKPCTQVANGLFMRLNGRIQLCPGTTRPNTIYGSVHKTPIAELWRNSPSYGLGARNNNWCPAKNRILSRSMMNQTQAAILAL